MIIGVSGNWRDDVSEHKLNDAYVRCIAENGGIPFVLPVVDREETISAYLDQIDALLLTGGGDIDPKYWGEELTEMSNTPSVKRDMFDMLLTEMAVKRGMRILGICRGMQALAVVSGGTIFQDIYKQHPGRKLIGHSQKAERCATSHEVSVEKGSVLAGIMQSERVSVNSFHHQAVRTVGEGCRIVAKSDDGIVEGIEFEHLPIVAVQWHPEELFNDHIEHNRLFEWLIR